MLDGAAMGSIMSNGKPLLSAPTMSTMEKDPVRDIKNDIPLDPKGTVEKRRGSGSSVTSDVSFAMSTTSSNTGQRLEPEFFPGGISGENMIPVPQFAAKLKRADGSKVFINVCTHESLLSDETIIQKSLVSDIICYDYIVNPERIVSYTLAFSEDDPKSKLSKEVVAAKNKVTHDAVKLISLKYGSLGLSGIVPSYPDTRNDHKGKLQPFQRSPSKMIPPSIDTPAEFRSFADVAADAAEPPPLKKGWVTVLGRGGKGLVGMGNKKRFVVLDSGLLSVYKQESDTAPYGHHKKDSMVLDGAVVLDDQHTVSSIAQRRASSMDSANSQKPPAHARRRSSVFGASKEVEARRIFINSGHGRKRIDLECSSVDERREWSLALFQHSEYAVFRVNEPSLITESFVDYQSDGMESVTDTDMRSSNAGKSVRRSSIAPNIWRAYAPYKQSGESVLEAGEVTMKIGLLGRYGPSRDLVSFD